MSAPVRCTRENASGDRCNGTAGHAGDHDMSLGVPARVRWEGPTPPGATAELQARLEAAARAHYRRSQWTPGRALVFAEAGEVRYLLRTEGTALRTACGRLYPEAACRPLDYVLTPAELRALTHPSMRMRMREEEAARRRELLRPDPTPEPLPTKPRRARGS